MKPMTYLAAPYSHEKQFIREFRFDQVNRAAAYLISKGFNVFSPISHSHPITPYLDNHNDSDFWVELDIDFLYHCQSVHVLMLPGWSNSSGIKRELIVANDLGLDVIYLDPKEIFQMVDI